MNGLPLWHCIIHTVTNTHDGGAVVPMEPFVVVFFFYYYYSLLLLHYSFSHWSRVRHLFAAANHNCIVNSTHVPTPHRLSTLYTGIDDFLFSASRNLYVLHNNMMIPRLLQYTEQ